MNQEDPRIEAFRGLLAPPMRIAGEDVAWTLDERLAHYDCPAVSVAVIENGELAWARAFGVLEKGEPAPADADTRFSGASISKPVTAALALKFVERGVFDLDVDVNHYLKSWRLPENEHTADTPVTLRWLLSHQAGTTVHGFGGMPPGAALPTALDVLEGRPPALTPPVRVDKRPGLSTRYSGGGTMIVQLLLEEASGRPFADLARELIFEPLGMNRTTFVNPLPEALRANAAVGHENGRTIPGRWVCVPQLAAGGIWTTAGDYARFMIACRDAWLGRPDTSSGAVLFNRDLADQMMTSQGGTFGLGWEVMGEGDLRRFSHGGSNDGYQCEGMGLLGSGNGAVVLTNAESGLILYWEVFMAVARAHGWEGFMPAPRTVRPIPPDEFDLYTGVYDIVSGVALPEMRVWAEGGELFTHIPGMRGGPNRPLMDQGGRLFNRARPSDTEIIRGPDGRAEELVVRMFGDAELLRLRRRA
jgi:CubicO group peptidase (beta-lactamase class C family)